MAGRLLTSHPTQRQRERGKKTEKKKRGERGFPSLTTFNVTATPTAGEEERLEKKRKRERVTAKFQMWAVRLRRQDLSQHKKKGRRNRKKKKKGGERETPVQRTFFEDVV